MFLTIQAAAREMIQRQIGGSIAMTASMSGTVANKGECLAVFALHLGCRLKQQDWSVSPTIARKQL